MAPRPEFSYWMRNSANFRIRVEGVTVLHADHYTIGARMLRLVVILSVCHPIKKLWKWHNSFQIKEKT